MTAFFLYKSSWLAGGWLAACWRLACGRLAAGWRAAGWLVVDADFTVKFKGLKYKMLDDKKANE